MDAERPGLPGRIASTWSWRNTSITTVPDPEAALDEFARVLKPGGEIVLLSRVGAEAGLRRALEHLFAPVARRLGWRTEFAWERYERWAERPHGVRLVERRPMPPLGHFSLDPLRQGRRRQRPGEATPATQPPADFPAVFLELSMRRV